MSSKREFENWLLGKAFAAPSASHEVEEASVRLAQATERERQRLASQFGNTLKGGTVPSHKPQVAIPSGEHIAIKALVFLAENNPDFTKFKNGQGPNVHHRNFIWGCYQLYTKNGYLSQAQITGLCLGAMHKCQPTTCGQPCPHFGKRTNEINGKTVSGLRFYASQLMNAGIIRHINDLTP